MNGLTNHTGARGSVPLPHYNAIISGADTCEGIFMLWVIGKTTVQ